MGLKIHGMAQLRQELADIAELHGGQIANKTTYNSKRGRLARR